MHYLQLFHFGAECATRNGLLPSLYQGITCDGNNPQITSVEDGVLILANIVRILIAISGSLAILFIMGASVFYITSFGDPGRIKKAKDMIVNTVIGLALVILSYTIVTFIAGEF